MSVNVDILQRRGGRRDNSKTSPARGGGKKRNGRAEKEEKGEKDARGKARASIKIMKNIQSILLSGA